MFKFIHCADLHLDSPLRGLSNFDDAPVEEIRRATRDALDNLVDLCIMERVAFLVIAGDVYDGDWDDYSTGLFFNRCMNRLRDADIPVYLIRGNHDAASHISKSLVMPDNVHELRTDEPETVILADPGVAIHGQGFAQRTVTENLASRYPHPVAGLFNIGLLHTCAEGREGHEPYAPCRVDELVQKGYQYWALGHIHKREVLHANPPVVFPGNLQGRHIREEGEKGCTLVTVNGSDVRLEHRSLDVLRWYTCTVDLSEADTAADFAVHVQSALADLVQRNPNHRLAVRVVCHGRTGLHGELLDDTERYRMEVQNAAMAVAADQMWIEKVKFQTQPVTSEVPAGSGTTDVPVAALGDALENIIEAARSDTEFIADFLRDVKLIQGNLREYVQTPDAAALQSEEDVRNLLGDAKALLMTALRKGVDN